MIDLSDDEMIVCRCEEITAGEIRQAIREGANSLTGVKRRTRAGMGLCQARTCETLVLRILAEELGKRTSEFAPTSVRPPVGPVTFGVLAGVADETGGEPRA